MRVFPETDQNEKVKSREKEKSMDSHERENKVVSRPGFLMSKKDVDKKKESMPCLVARFQEKTNRERAAADPSERIRTESSRGARRVVGSRCRDETKVVVVKRVCRRKEVKVQKRAWFPLTPRFDETS